MATNEERSAATRGRLIATARPLFARYGYADAGTEAILEGAGVKRGALYHHFSDKAALFEAVCEVLCREAMAEVESAASAAGSPLKGLEAGSLAWIRYVMRPDVRRILILDAPTVLGWTRWNALDQRYAYQLLREGVAGVLRARALSFSGRPESLAAMLNGALNALALRAGAEDNPMPLAEAEAAIRALLRAMRPRGGTARR